MCVLRQRLDVPDGREEDDFFPPCFDGLRGRVRMLRDNMQLQWLGLTFTGSTTQDITEGHCNIDFDVNVTVTFQDGNVWLVSVGLELVFVASGQTMQKMIEL